MQAFWFRMALHAKSFCTNVLFARMGLNEWLQEEVRTQEVRTDEDPGIKKNTEDARNQQSCLRACF